MKKFPAIAFSLITAFFLCGCPAELKITPKANGEFAFEFNTAFEKETIGALQDLTAASSQLLDEKFANIDKSQILSQIIDTNKVEQELNSSVFALSQAKIQNNKSLKVTANSKNKDSIAKTLSQEKLKNGKTRLVLTISTESLQSTLLKDGSTLKTFADILMAPILNGEKMPIDEYKDLLIEVYGEKVTEELLSQNFAITLINPNGKNISQNIPIANLLISTKPQTFVFEY